MIDTSEKKPKSPSSRSASRPLLAVAAGLAAVIFVADVLTPPAFGISELFIIPLLLSTLTGSPRIAQVGGGIASALVLFGHLRVPWAITPWFVIANHAFALAVIWTTVFTIVGSRQASIDLEDRTRDLADVSFALNQSAIVAITDTRGIIGFANEKFCEISKYSREELLGQDHRILNSGYHSKEFMRGLWTTIANGHIWRGEIRNRAKDGSFYWVDTTIVPFLDPREKPYQYMAIRYDISDRKRSEKLLQERAALARLGEMAAVVAHEVKNPIAGIRGALQVISSRMPPERDRAVVGDIISRLDALNNVVEDLLVFARPRDPRLERVDVTALLGTTIDLIRRDPTFSAIDMHVDGSGCVILVDTAQMQLVFQNILMNAAQAMNGRGTIAVTTAPADGMCRVAIADAGPGMPPHVRDQAFEPFFTTKNRGTGLGLPIAKRIVEAHGGQIQIEATPTGGTVVTLLLPSAS